MLGAPLPHLFSAAGEAALAAALQHRPLLAFDFDGTLAPIVARPDDARPSQAVASRLAALAARLPVAVVSGRRVADLRERLGFEPRFVVGNHGAEDADAPAAAEAPALTGLRLRIRHRQAALAAAGVTVEDKGLSIALHYRLSRTREQALQAIGELLAGRDAELQVFGGKLVVNVAPAGAPDKAQAVRGLMQRCGAAAVVYVGDDVNDEPVFAAAGAGWLTVRVGREDPRSRALYFLDTTAEMPMLLQRMLALLSPTLNGG